MLAGGESGLVNASGFFESLESFLEAELPESDEIIYGGRRGQLSMLVSITNLGKTTLMLNLAIRGASGDGFQPLLPKPERPIKTMILDMEATGKELQSDFLVMIEGVQNRELLVRNIIPVVDAEIEDENLNLSNTKHYDFVLEKARGAEIDLLIVDTCSSAFDIEDENSNAEVRREILMPLKRLAREARCHVLLAHHIGKASEDPTRRTEAVHLGRGASVFGGLSRAVFTLTPERTLGPGYVSLSCAKIKGHRFEDTLLCLDQSKRWFQIPSRNAPAKARLNVEEVAAFIAGKGQASTSEINDHFASRVSERTIASRVASANELGLISKDNKHSAWRLAVKAPQEATSDMQSEADIRGADCSLVPRARMSSLTKLD